MSEPIFEEYRDPQISDEKFQILKMYYDGKLKFDGDGLPFLSELPDVYRLATINDFHVNKQKKIGMHFLIKWADRDDYYEVRMIDEKITAADLVPFIDDKRVFIKD
jgi:hypothetical protein